MTYQVGAENMIDPYVDDALVSLSELRDAQFSDIDKFACGHNFVIGVSTKFGEVEPINSSVKTAGHNFHPANPIREVSPNKESVHDNDMSMQLVSPDASKQSFPQRALYQGSISPSTPTENNSLRSYSGMKSVKWRHKELVGALKHVEGCRPILSETPRVTSKHHERTNGYAQVSAKHTIAVASSQQMVDKENQFSKTTKL